MTRYFDQDSTKYLYNSNNIQDLQLLALKCYSIIVLKDL